MAKERKFNIGKVAEAAEQTLRPASTLPQPTENVVESKTKPSPTPSAETPTKFRGRKKVVRTIPKTNGKTLYFDEEMNKLLREAAWNCQLDMQDIVRVACKDFFENHYNDGSLDESGRQMVIDYVKSTTNFVE